MNDRIEAGWYPDPDPQAAAGSQRWWDGSRWTDHVQVAAPAEGHVSVPPTHGQPAPGRRTRAGLLIALAILVPAVSAGAAIAYRVATSDGPTAVPADVPGDRGSSAPSADEPTDEAASPAQAGSGSGRSPGSSPSPSPSAPATRDASLFAGIAKLRTAPALDAPEVATITGREGAPILVHGRAQRGWYEVTLDGRHGWLFGSFVLPPDDGLFVLLTRDNGPAELLDRRGQPLGIVNESGNKVLGVDVSGHLWQVLLPDGSTAWVDADRMLVAGT